MFVIVVKSPTTQRFDVVGPFVSVQECARWVNEEAPPGITFKIGKMTCPDCWLRQFRGEMDGEPVIALAGGQAVAACSSVIVGAV